MAQKVSLGCDGLIVIPPMAIGGIQIKRNYSQYILDPRLHGDDIYSVFLIVYSLICSIN